MVQKTFVTRSWVEIQWVAGLQPLANRKVFDRSRGWRRNNVVHSFLREGTLGSALGSELTRLSK